MQTKTYTIYTFDELDESAKDKARQWYREGALDYEWWDIYPDDYALDEKHFYFDLYRRTIDIRPSRSAEDTAKHIVENHGEHCDSYIVAKEYLTKLDAFDYGDDEYDYGKKEALEEMADDFMQQLGECVLSSLIKEEEYLMSDEAVDESILANEYTFDENGNWEN